MKDKPKILEITLGKSKIKDNNILHLKNNYILKQYNLRLNENIQTQADQLIENLNYKPDGIIAFNENTTLFASFIIKKLNLFGPKHSSLIEIQNKESFANKLKDKVYLPQTNIVSKENIDELKKLNYPIFIKPTKGAFSHGALKINKKSNSKKIILDAIDAIKINNFDKSSNSLSLKKFIVQPFINQRQFTLDGFIFKSKIFILGITESIYDEKRQSFIRFDFPIIFKSEINLKLKNIMEDIFQQFSFDNSFFNLEFFLTNTDEIKVIEVNTRPSISFKNFFDSKYKQGIIEMMILLSLGLKPSLELKDNKVIGKSFILRKYQDCLIKRKPKNNEINNINSLNPFTKVRIFVKENERLSQLKQDSYSFRYGLIDICGETDNEIFSRFKKIKNELDKLINFSPVSD
ncbi:MAG: ATP-grasp domain-containing protein [Candidatus Pacebacteria bacterium]|nr:ATP-grasp domain-containing protein [Candidatus Paceibacterota bacterium]